MNASDVMVTNVITVGPDTSVRDVAHILLTNRISGLPVVNDAGELVGIVSEGDLMRRVEADTGRRRAWWLSILTGNETLAAEYVREHSRKVSDVMTTQVVTAPPDAPLRKIASLLEKNGIKRVPIVKDRKVIGIVSRANLLHALASLSKLGDSPATVDDATLRETVLARLNSEPWGSTALLNVVVHDGTVDLWGVVRSQAEKKAVRVAAEVTSGVRAVNDNLLVRPVESGV